MPLDFMALAEALPVEVEIESAPVVATRAPVVLREIHDSLDMVPVRRSLAEFEVRCNDLLAQADQIKINGPVSQKNASEMGAKAHDLIKQIEARRKEIAAPAEGFTKSVKRLADSLTAPLIQVKAQVAAKLAAYQGELKIKQVEAERKAQEAAQAERKRLEAMAAEAKVDLPPEELAPAPAPVVPAKAKVTTESGTSYSRKTWTFEVADPAAVPREFLVVDEKAIRAAVKAGAREIPGVRIFETETMAFRS